MACNNDFGEDLRGSGTRYVSTTGGYGFPVNGTFIEGGKVVAIQV